MVWGEIRRVALREVKGLCAHISAGVSLVPLDAATLVCSPAICSYLCTSASEVSVSGRSRDGMALEA